MAAMHIRSPGLFTTVQDAGRPGFAALGVPSGGAADQLSLRAGNRMLGNDDNAAALECTLTGPVIEFEGAATIALTGAACDARLDGEAAPMWRALAVRAGQALTLGAMMGGCRAYVCVRGGIDVPLVMRSRSTLPSAGFGGLEGRALRAGDVLPIGSSGRSAARGEGRSGEWVIEVITRRTLRVIAARADDPLPRGVIERVLDAAWRIGDRSDRTGVRLEGEAVAFPHGGRLASEGMPHGAIQLPESGLPIILGVDRPTTGGYPLAGCIISADLPALGQLRPRETVRFQRVTLDEARRLAREEAAAFDRWSPRAENAG